MNEQTAKLIADLATKLGTTADHLWSVLVKQAPIDAASDCVVIVASAIGIVIVAKGGEKLAKHSDNLPEAAAVFSFLLLFCFGVVAIIALIAGLCSCGDIMAGFFNPEYWAFRHIVK